MAIEWVSVTDRRPLHKEVVFAWLTPQETWSVCVYKNEIFEGQYGDLWYAVGDPDAPEEYQACISHWTSINAPDVNSQ